jgi:hypothetical protein
MLLPLHWQRCFPSFKSLSSTLEFRVLSPPIMHYAGTERQVAQDRSEFRLSHFRLHPDTACRCVRLSLKPRGTVQEVDLMILGQRPFSMPCLRAVGRLAHWISPATPSVLELPLVLLPACSTQLPTCRCIAHVDYHSLMLPSIVVSCSSIPTLSSSVTVLQAEGSLGCLKQKKVSRGAITDLIGCDVLALTGAQLNVHVNVCTCRRPVALTSLRSLNLSQTTIGDKGATALHESLEALVHLTSLRVRECRLQDHGCSLVAKLLRECNYIAELDLSWNVLGPLACAAVIDCLPDASNLKVLPVVAL